MQLQLPDRDFDGYIFDCDGTLVDTMPLHYEAWNYGIQAAGAEWEFPPDLFYSWAGRPIDEVVGSLNERFGWDLDPETVTFHKERFFHARTAAVKPIPAVVAILGATRARGKKVAVASGSSRETVLEVLDRSGIGLGFDAIVTAEDVRHGKPAPDIFLEAARRMGVDPGQCLVFEDGQLGIEAAKAAGMATVLVESHPDLLERSGQA